MSAPSYYDNSTNTILDGTVASASDVENKCDDIASSLAEVAADMDNTVRFTNADFTDQTLASNAATRANKVLGFDESGAVVLYDTLEGTVTSGSGTFTALNVGDLYPDAIHPQWAVKASNYTAAAGDLLVCDLSGGAWQLTMPATPSQGDTVRVKVLGANSYTLTIDGNSENVLGETSVTVTCPYLDREFVYFDASFGWV